MCVRACMGMYQVCDLHFGFLIESQHETLDYFAITALANNLNEFFSFFVTLQLAGQIPAQMMWAARQKGAVSYTLLPGDYIDYYIV